MYVCISTHVHAQDEIDQIRLEMTGIGQLRESVG